MDLWLAIHIPLHCLYPCNCSRCIGVVEAMEVDQPINLTTEKIAQESIKLRDSGFSDAAILHCARQILFKQGSTDAKLVRTKLLKTLRILRE